nr:acetyl-CoA carboxylase 1 [Tanacetum cinerariifolium]
MSEAQRMPLTGSFNYGNGHMNGVISLRSSASRTAIDEFCNALGGKRPIHSILIANNGMAAVKFIRSVRTWSYETFGSEKAILLVAMATPEDMRINAEHIRIADQFVEVPGGTNNNNYANVQLIVETAEITHVDAVWPGWGHASEIPELPDALEAKRIIFLGPPATSMAALGDKIGSSLIAQAADVPTLPWSGSHVKIPADSCLVSIPDDVYRQACVYTTEEAVASCQVVGYPAMIKASWGGGGKGIRKVHNDEEVKALFKQVQGEVPGSPIFIMKVASQSRHLEVQLLCDQHGNVAALHSRDCSVQRRHQKLRLHASVARFARKREVISSIGGVKAPKVNTPPVSKKCIYSFSSKATSYAKVVQDPSTSGEKGDGVTIPMITLSQENFSDSPWPSLDAIRISTAEITHVDAVWPGWGHASEIPELPDALEAKRIIFLGPPATSMAALGDKIGSSLIAQAADVKIPADSCLVSIPDDVYRQACVYTTEEAVASCQVVGYPAMIKASWGGGGKGIRKVHNDEEVKALFKQVQGEVPGSPIFIMKVASQSRHLEVQLLCDQHGNVAALHSRDCSVQRRHQKIIEEGPITVAPHETIKKLEQAARRLAKSVNYVGAATVEYLYSMETGDYYFLELNPRLQVHNDEEVKALFKQVQGEVPGSPIFIMKVASQSRHLEVQLLCDQHGNVAALHSRDCSVQRRHQKIIEEGPITVAPQETIKKLEQAARRLAKSVNYIGAATVEYLYSMETGDYYFLELNPRLQVEHPVTEWIAEINLPAAQVAVGMGIPLWQIPEIRRFYGMDNSGGYDAWRATSDPDDGFKPTGGKVQELSFKSKPNSWAYFSVKSGGGIHEFSDSQFGHVFAFGESRTLAIANMVLGLKEIQIRGEIRTNVDYTIDLLHAPDYRDNKIHTGWLDSRIAMRVRAERPPWYLSVVGGALYKAAARSAAMVSDYVGYLEKGQIPPKHISLINSQVSLNIEGSKYTIDMVKRGPGGYRLKMNRSEIEAEIHTLRDGGLLMQLDGNSHIIYAEEEAAGTRLLIDGRTCLLQNDHDPSKLMAETPCKLLRYLVSDGSHVDADTPYAEVEVMKMCMPLLSPASGVIQFKMSEGQAMQAGELIARLDLDDPSAVRKAEPFNGSFPVLGSPTAMSDKVHQKCAATLSAARMILAGYDHNIDEVVQNLLRCLDSPELPFLQWQECYAVLANRLPKDLKTKLESKFKEYEGISFQQTIDFPAKVLRGILETHVGSCSEKEKGAQERLVEPLMSLVKSYEGGRESHARGIVHALFEEYLSVEELFSDNIQADVIERLRLQYKKDLLRVVDIVLSHQGVKIKNKLILRLMEHLVYPNPAAYREKLIRFSQLNHMSYSELALKASQLLEQTKLSELRSSIARSLSELEMFTEEGESMDTPKRKSAINERMEDIVSAPLAVEDALVALFDHSDHTLQRRVVETYVRRLYQPYLVKGSVRMQWHRAGLIASWQFMEGHIDEMHVSDFEMTETPLPDKNWGAMVIIKSLQFLPDVISATLKETTHKFPSTSQERPTDSSNHGNMLHIALAGINNQMSLLQDRDEGRGPMRHSFHWSEENQYYVEEPLLRHLEPPLSIYLELDKLKGYENIKYTPSRDRQWHMYTVDAKPLPVQRMFLRTLVRQPTKEWFSGYQGSDISRLSLPFTSRSILRSLVTAMEELELHVHNATVKSDHAHMYLYILKEQQLDDLVHYSQRVNVDSGSEEANGAWRVVVTNVTGQTCVVNVYRELEDGDKHKVVYHATSTSGPLHGVPVSTPFQPLGLLDQKRLLARKSNTTYCYDFALAFEAALENIWSKLPNETRPEGKLVNVRELAFADPKGSWGTPLVAVNREPGKNNVGMVAWTMELFTPEFPYGRTIMVVANDVTFKNGSFGPIEDAFFEAVTDLACAKKLPLIYLAANSGARIGAAEEVRACFKIGWSDELSPDS